MYYQFVLNMWVMEKVDEAWVQSCVNKYITQEECDMILLTPQGGLDSVALKATV